MYYNYMYVQRVVPVCVPTTTCVCVILHTYTNVHLLVKREKPTNWEYMCAYHTWVQGLATRNA